MGIGKVIWGNPRYETLVDHGDPRRRLDIAILGDGYTQEEMPLFYEDVNRIIQAFHEIEPMQSYIQHFNFHRVNVMSQQSGVDDRWQKPPVKRRSALGTHFSWLNERRLVGPDPWVQFVAWRAGVPWDSLLVVVNTPRRGGATLFTMGVGYASRNSSDFPRIMIHEAGHAIAKLADEYGGELPDIKLLRGRSLPNILPFANVSTNLKRPKWAAWLSQEVARGRPTPEENAPFDCVGAFEGASYVNFGVYRAQPTCMMKRHSSDFCCVCQEQWIKRIYRRSPISDGFSPASGWGRPALRVNPYTPLTFEAQVIHGEHIHTTWRISERFEREWQVRQFTTDYAPFTGRFVPGHWLVECVLEDRNPKIRKPGVHRATRQRHRWWVISQT